MDGAGPDGDSDEASACGVVSRMVTENQMTKRQWGSFPFACVCMYLCVVFDLSYIGLWGCWSL